MIITPFTLAYAIDIQPTESDTIFGSISSSHSLSNVLYETETIHTYEDTMEAITVAVRDTIDSHFLNSITEYRSLSIVRENALPITIDLDIIDETMEDEFAITFEVTLDKDIYYDNLPISDTHTLDDIWPDVEFNISELLSNLVDVDINIDGYNITIVQPILTNLDTNKQYVALS